MALNIGESFEGKFGENNFKIKINRGIWTPNNKNFKNKREGEKEFNEDFYFIKQKLEELELTNEQISLMAILLILKIEVLIWNLKYWGENQRINKISF